MLNLLANTLLWPLLFRGCVIYNDDPQAGSAFPTNEGNGYGCGYDMGLTSGTGFGFAYGMGQRDGSGFGCSKYADYYTGGGMHES